MAKTLPKNKVTKAAPVTAKAQAQPKGKSNQLADFNFGDEAFSPQGDDGFKVPDIPKNFRNRKNIPTRGS